MPSPTPTAAPISPTAAPSPITSEATWRGLHPIAAISASSRWRSSTAIAIVLVTAIAPSTRARTAITSTALVTISKPGLARAASPGLEIVVVPGNARRTPAATEPAERVGLQRHRDRRHPAAPARQPLGGRNRHDHPGVLEPDPGVVDAHHREALPLEGDVVARPQAEPAGKLFADHRLVPARPAPRGEDQAARHEALRPDAEDDRRGRLGQRVGDELDRRRVLDARPSLDPGDQRLGQHRGGGVGDPALEDAEVRPAEVAEAAEALLRGPG